MATMRQKLLKAVKKGKSIEAERDALAKRVEEMEAERKRLEDALGERAAERTSTANAEQEKELASLKEQLERNSEALEYAKGEAHQAAGEARDQESCRLVEAASYPMGEGRCAMAAVVTRDWGKTVLEKQAAAVGDRQATLLAAAAP